MNYLLLHSTISLLQVTNTMTTIPSDFKVVNLQVVTNFIRYLTTQLMIAAAARVIFIFEEWLGINMMIFGVKQTGLML